MQSRFEENCDINFLCISLILICASRNSGVSIFIDVCDMNLSFDILSMIRIK